MLEEKVENMAVTSVRFDQICSKQLHWLDMNNSVEKDMFTVFGLSKTFSHSMSNQNLDIFSKTSNFDTKLADLWQRDFLRIITTLES